MIRDITIGQYFPGNSSIHCLDPRAKILLVLAYVFLLFIARNIPALLIGTAAALVGYWISRIPLKMILKSIKSIAPIILFTAVLNMLFVEGDIVWEWYFFRITRQGVLTAVLMIIRIISLIAGTTLLTYTTSPIALTDGIERLLEPLKRLRMPVHELAMMMTIALRFIPTLIEETDKIISAQKARGADMESGSLVHRAKALIPILIPLFVGAFRRADELALAMECRCYRGDVGRTRMKQLSFGYRDVVAAVGMTVLLGVVLTLNFLLPSIL